MWPVWREPKILEFVILLAFCTCALLPEQGEWRMLAGCSISLALAAVFLDETWPRFTLTPALRVRLFLLCFAGFFLRAAVPKCQSGHKY